MFLKSLIKETRFGASLLFLLLLSMGLQAQPGYGPGSSPSSGEMLEQLRKLQVLGKVLYVAAHPDDENTRMLAWLAREKKVETAYLSLTRGDGGQNLIGKEVREGLGLIRTQELLAARRLDGAQQFFTRANDFGFSKNPEETFTKWDRDSLLADVVWVIRKFQPDVIITRFTPEPSPTHGHHTASAQLAVEAFAAAADPKRFPEQLAYLQTWQARSIYWNTSWWFYGREDFDKTGFLPVDVGSYNAVLGTGYGEIASASRSMHKSQGFGAARQRGEEVEYLQPLAGETSVVDLFDGLTLSWKRVAGGAAVQKALQAAEKAYDASAPWKSLPALLKARAAMEALPDGPWKALKLQQLSALLLDAAGVWHEWAADKYSYVAGDSMLLNFRSIVRHPVEVQLAALEMQSLSMYLSSDVAPYGYASMAMQQEVLSLPFNRLLEVKRRLAVPNSVPESTPFWLQEPGNGFFDLPDQRWVGYAENPAAFSALASYRIQVGKQWHMVQAVVPAYYRWTDPADSERYRPVEILHPAYLKIEKDNYLSAGEAVEVRVLVSAMSDVAAAEVRLELPTGWFAEPEQHAIKQLKAGGEQMLSFWVQPGKATGSGTVKASIQINGSRYERSLQRITYPHLPISLITPLAEAKLLNLDRRREKKRIGYLPGAGDDIPAALQALGYVVEEILPENCHLDHLKRYESIVAGVRIANIEGRIESKMPVLMAYVEQGGTLIFQYNTSQSLKTTDLGPYPFKLGRERVTVEEAPVSMLQPAHPLLNHPYKITQSDFDGWVQERGLYFPASWDSAYTPLLRMNDPGEKPLDGALLYARYGKGVYIYSGLSWFRQLPAGVPGAYRLFVNLIEAK
ncbi:MAG: PIG-L family deacetylase [Sphingobacteriaceae bacterium]|nr:PIG-L family deacetylase [Sphingobacteriaceae bacterium]